MKIVKAHKNTLDDAADYDDVNDFYKLTLRIVLKAAKGQNNSQYCFHVQNFISVI